MFIDVQGKITQTCGNCNHLQEKVGTTHGTVPFFVFVCFLSAHLSVDFPICN